MKCDLCAKNDARVHLTQTFPNGIVKKIDLCEDCAKRHGVNDPTGFSLVSLLEQVKSHKKPS